MAIHFLRLYWFLAILPMIFFCCYFAKSHLVNNWQQICDEHLLTHLLVYPKRKFNLPILLLAIGSLLTIFALAGPSWEKEIQPIYRTLLGNILVLDLAPSMADSIATAKKIDRVRYKLLDFLDRSKEGMTGLVVYTDEAHTISPLTDDNHTIANFIPALHPNIMPTFNDNTEVGLEEAGKLFKQAGISSGNIILITDKITHFSVAKKMASSLYEQGYRLFIFNVSEEQHNDEMYQLATTGGGKVITLSSNNNDIDQLFENTKPTSFIPPLKKTSENGIFWQDNGRFIVFFILPLALIAFRRGYL